MKAESDTISEEIQISVEINGEVWTRVNSFRHSGPEDKHYVVEVERNGGAIIKFGDGKKGRRPSPGSDITAHYRNGAGASGNLSRKRLKISFNWDGDY